jgi:hypothetical protein
VRRTEADGVAIASERVNRLARMFADEASHWDALHDGWQTYADQSQRGVQRARCVRPTWRKATSRGFAGWWTDSTTTSALATCTQYAAHAAWLEDHRRLDNGAL